MNNNAVVLVLAMLLTGQAVPALAADVVARVGGREVTLDDVRAYVETLPDAEQAALAKEPGRLSQVVRLYLARQELLREARDRKFDQQAETKAQIERVKEAALVEMYLQSVAKIPDSFPSDAEIQAAYDANKSAFVAPRQYRLAQIFVAAAKDEKGNARLDDAVRRLKARGADFAQVARDLSEQRAEAEKGGEIGWVAETGIVPPIARAVSGLGKDEVSDPIRVEDGWHIVKLLDTRPAGTLSLAEVKEPLRARLRQQRAQQARQAYLARLVQQNPPAINELALSKLVLKTDR